MAKQAKTKQKEQESEIRKLRSENQRLKREVRALKEELEQQRGISPSHAGKGEAALEKHARNERLFSRKRYVAYVYDLIRHTSVFALYSRMLQFVRRYTLIRTTLKIITALLAVLETSAVFVLAASFFVVSLPVTVLISYAALLFTFFRGRRHRKRIQERIRQKKIVIFFPPKHYDTATDSFFSGMVRSEAQKGDRFCVIVSPYFLKSTGLDPNRKNSYLIARFEEDNLLLIRRHYYFTLKKKIFASHSLPITEIY